MKKNRLCSLFLVGVFGSLPIYASDNYLEIEIDHNDEVQEQDQKNSDPYNMKKFWEMMHKNIIYQQYLFPNDKPGPVSISTQALFTKYTFQVNNKHMEYRVQGSKLTVYEDGKEKGSMLDPNSAASVIEKYSKYSKK